jgi:hypothetical protein
VRNAGMYPPETRTSARGEAERTVPPHAAPTEEMPVILKSRNGSSDYEETAQFGENRV